MGTGIYIFQNIPPWGEIENSCLGKKIKKDERKKEKKLKEKEKKGKEKGKKEGKEGKMLKKGPLTACFSPKGQNYYKFSPF